MITTSVRAIVKLAAFVFAIAVGAASANGQDIPTGGAPVRGQITAVGGATLNFFQQYKRVMHLMDLKEISREALAEYDKAVDLLTAGDSDGALDALESAQVIDVLKEESRVLWAPYSTLIGDRGLYPRGIAFLQRLTLEHPKLPHLHTDLAATYGMYAGWLKMHDPRHMLGVSQLSLSEYEVALALGPDAFQANYGHATYLSYMPGREADWEKEFRKLIAMRPADMHGYPFPAVYQSFIDGLIRSGQEQKARLVLKEALALYPKSPGLQSLARKLPEQQ
ncbi:MAG: hypothetical protein DMF61_23140 [Blastocatellia bacterium AA13]|nr:MAG: hypothetical protein DMF61_23140 [Blastocatellia bacterium AA13]